MEVVFETAMPLKPGQIIAFDDGQENHPPVYAVIDALKSLDDASRPTCQMARLSVLYGEPSLSITGASIIDDDALLNHVMELLPEADYPVQLGAFSADIRNFGTATFIQDDELEASPSSFESKRAVLEVLMGQLSQYQRVLVIDPLGLFVSEPGQHVLRAGLDTRLSIAHLGAKRLSEALEQYLPNDVLRDVSGFFSGALAIGQGDTNEVVSLQALMAHAKSECPDDLKAVVASCLTQMHRTGVFAESMEQVFSSHQLPNVPVTVLDVSGLSEPWKTLFYHWATSQFLQTSGGDVVSVLIYPENYMPKFDTWLRKVNEADLMTFVLSSPYMKDEFRDLADTTMDVNDDTLHLHGDITCHLPVAIAMQSLGFDDIADFNEGSGETGLKVPAYDDEQSDGTLSQVKIHHVEHDPDALDISGLVPEAPIRPVGITDMFEDDLDTPPPPLDDDGFGDDDGSYFDSILGGSLTDEPSDSTDGDTADEPTSSFEEPVLLNETDVETNDEPMFELGNDEVLMASEPAPSIEPVDEPADEPEAIAPIAVEDDNDDDDDFFFDIDLDKKLDSPTSDDNASSDALNDTPTQSSEPTPDTAVVEATPQSSEPEKAPDPFGFDDIPMMDDFGASDLFGVPEQSEKQPEQEQKPEPQQQPQPEQQLEAPLFDDVAEPFDMTSSQGAPEKNQTSNFGQSLQEQLMQEQRAMYGDVDENDSSSPSASTSPVSSVANDPFMSEEIEIAPSFEDDSFKEPSSASDNVPASLQSTDPVSTSENAPTSLSGSDGFTNADKETTSAGNDDTTYDVGDEVHHPDHGRGVVSRVMPMEQGVVLNIAFDSVGKRIMDPKLVPLEKR